VLSRQMDQGQRGPVTNCAMGSHFVVLCTPFFNLFAGVVQIEEPMLAEALEPDRGVEAFHVGIVGRLAWAAEVQRDAVRIGP
jgi:hypothetical protein